MSISYCDFLKNKPSLIKPYALMDLDDTLFQTKRKLPSFVDDNALIVASVNKKNEPLSFMTQKQASFFCWLSNNTTLIPVTARDTLEIQRVKLPFMDYQILTHGAVIVQKDGSNHPAWQFTLFSQLYHHQNALHCICDNLNSLQDISITPHSDVFCDTHLMIYVAVKHIKKDHNALQKLADDLPSLCQKWGINFADFYVHCNANNLAILPKCVHKKHAVAFLKQHYFKDNIPLFGFGDSLADLPFLTLLDWYGTPNQGQLHNFIYKDL